MTDNVPPKQPIDPGPWNLSQEREFSENLLCQRFNFFLVVFSLVAAGAAGANTQRMLLSLLLIGFFICLLLALTIYRNHVKLDWIHQTLHKVEGHPIKVVGDAIEPLGLLKSLDTPWGSLFRVTWIIGWFIPLIACLALLAGAIAASACWLRAN